MPRKQIKYCGYCGTAIANRKIQGRSRLFCPACNEIWYQNPIPAATALVLNDQQQILLGKRKTDPQKGKWCLPGGFIEQGETMAEAALRELKEETGLVGRVMSLVDCFYQESRFYGSLIIFGYRVSIQGGTLCADDDLEEVCFFDLDNFPPLAFESHRKLVAEFKKIVADDRVKK
jgi:mutator protein MutT